VRDRYDGEKRNPWNEIECGSNYARSMATYSLLGAFSGFEFDMTRGFIGFRPIAATPDRFRAFWSLDGGWGQLRSDEGSAELEVRYGALTVRELKVPFEPGGISVDGKAVAFSLDGGRIKLAESVTLKPGMVLQAQKRIGRTQI
jgi:hypothetical protein